MTSRTLFSALTSAQAGTTPAGRIRPVLADDTTLLTALRNCATDRDQIIRRHVGIVDDA